MRPLGADILGSKAQTSGASGGPEEMRSGAVKISLADVHLRSTCLLTRLPVEMKMRSEGSLCDRCKLV